MCVFGGDVEEYTFYEDRGNNRYESHQSHIFRDTGKCQYAVRKVYLGASKSRGNVGFLIWVGDTYMFTVLIFFAFHRKQLYIIYVYQSIPNYNYWKKGVLVLENCEKQWNKAEIGARHEMARRAEVLLSWESILTFQLQFIRDGT